MAVTLVTGGARSGKSRHAEQLVLGATSVTYLATGRPADPADPEWSVRLTRHQARRPSTWRTVETLDLVPVLREAPGTLLVECLGTWLTGLVDRAQAWDDLERAASVVHDEAAALCAALTARSRDTVLVTNEVGMALVPQTSSGRFFQDELGRLNASVGAVADQVHLVVAGRVLDLSQAPVVP
jgi:adenosylcobinamide kinase/adenosylcobinamide-phosphate guanylyltransferase